MSEFKNPIPADKIPHSPQMSRKMASSLLERHFFCSFASPRRRRGGMSERSDEIPESVCSFSFVPSYVARAPSARWEGSAKERSDCANPAIKNLPAEQCREIAYISGLLVSEQPMISHRATSVLCHGQYH